MNDVLQEMRRTNCFITKKAIFDYGKERQRPRYVYEQIICLQAIPLKIGYLNKLNFIEIEIQKVIHK